MKKMELKQIIREEISSMKAHLSESRRYKNYLKEAGLEDKTIKNPDTGKDIKMSSALSYDKDSSVYQKAKSWMKNLIGKKEKSAVKGGPNIQKIPSQFKNLDAKTPEQLNKLKDKANKVYVKMMKKFSPLEKRTWSAFNSSTLYPPKRLGQKADIDDTLRDLTKDDIDEFEKNAIPADFEAIDYLKKFHKSKIVYDSVKSMIKNVDAAIANKV